VKVLYVGSKADEAHSLNLEREITELQRRFGAARGERVDFSFMPRVLAEELPFEIAKARPDILHLSTHGTRENLALANEAGAEIRITAEALCAYFSPEKPPRLVYLNACDSQDIAKCLADRIAMAIGFTAPITNRAARSAAVLFYTHLLEGASVEYAFRAAQKTVEALQSGSTSAVLHSRAEIDPSKQFFHRVPKIVARYKGGRPDKWKGRYPVTVGVAGCPTNTTQVVVSTDDISALPRPKADAGPPSLESTLCRVGRSRPVDGVVWLDDQQSWEVRNDLCLVASIMTSEGGMLAIRATRVAEAIENYYHLAPDGRVPDDVANALAILRSKSGPS
jgi:hypothetical protein